jgi:hypothetical protein
VSELRRGDEDHKFYNRSAGNPADTIASESLRGEVIAATSLIII